MASARHVIVAGAGIAGLTAALALARAGLRVSVLEQAAKLEETGAGIQLSPNATRVLIALGLRERLAPSVMAPQAIRVMAGGSGREIVRMPLSGAEARYGAPFWAMHRGDLCAARQQISTLGRRPERCQRNVVPTHRRGYSAAVRNLDENRQSAGAWLAARPRCAAGRGSG